MTDLTLQDNFPAVTRDMWRGLAEKGLRGEAYEQLISTTEDGLPRGPLFDDNNRPVHHAPLPRTDAPQLGGRAWHICAPVLSGELAHANTQLLEDLTGGCSAVYVDGPKVERRADLRHLFEGVHLDLVPVLFAPEHAAADFAPQMDELAGTHVLLGRNPLGDLPDLPRHWRAFTVNAAQVHEDGGTDVLELAVFAALTAESFRRHGMTAHTHMSALLSVGTDAHLSIVKLRTARRIYARIADAFGVKDAALPLQAITSLSMMQSEDAWTNLLRTMSAAFGAITGGADYVISRPFTETPQARRLGEATRFAHRIARNQQLMMMEESHIGQVKDAAFGSYFHEGLGEDMAQATWAKFQQIEAQGGVNAYRETGDYEANIEAAKTERGERGDPVLGVTLHPAPDAPKPEVR